MALKILSGKTLLWLFLMSPVFYIAACNLKSERKANAFAMINVGDTRDVVIGRLGIPSHIERPGALFARYASHQCQSPCVERLWFENRLSFDVEAWSVALDTHGKVIEKTHWSSP